MKLKPIVEKYEGNQAKWIKKFKVKVGDTVTVFVHPSSDVIKDSGWPYGWSTEMRKGTYKVGKISKRGIMLTDEHFYPFFCMVKITMKRA